MNNKTVKQILIENEVYGTTAISKKMNVLNEYLIKEKKKYAIDTRDSSNVIEMLNIVLSTAKGKPKEKLLIILSEFGYEINPKDIEVKTNLVKTMIPESTSKKLATIDSRRNVSSYDVYELIKEIDSFAKSKIDKKKKVAPVVESE